jgi:hypothetical protein
VQRRPLQVPWRRPRRVDLVEKAGKRRGGEGGMRAAVAGRRRDGAGARRAAELWVR